MPTPHKPHTEVSVDKLPPCDLCADGTAEYDFKTSFGPWGYGCPPCFRKYGGSLGLGKGQHLVVDEKPSAAAEFLAEGKVS